MQWIEGESLAGVLARETRLPLAGVIELGITLARTLTYIHTKKQQVIHRDIKPGNIILQENGEPILIDFDIARAMGQVETAFAYDEQGNTHSFGGTEYYAAPEQFTNPKNVTDRTDIYSLGVVFYEALTGLGPDNNPYPSSQWENPQDSPIPVSLWSILRKMLSEDPQDRPDAQHLAQQLEYCLQVLEK
jgi:serine/threonine-protein kinase